jgi:hypothetical protein
MENTDKFYVSKITNIDEERDEQGVLLSVQVDWITTREYSFDEEVQTVSSDFSVRFRDSFGNLPPDVVLSESEITEEFLMTCVQYLIDTSLDIKSIIGRVIYDKHFMSDLIPSEHIGK